MTVLTPYCVSTSITHFSLQFCVQCCIDVEADVEINSIQFNVLARKFRFCSSGVKNVLFHSYCGTMYTSSLWCKFKKQSLKSVHVAYNNSFRILHQLPARCSASFMFVSNHIKSFNELTRSSIFSLLRRLQDSKNPLFVNYFYTDIHFRSPMFKYWTTQLYV